MSDQSAKLELGPGRGPREEPMSITLPAGLGLAVTQRIVAIIKAAPCAADGTMTDEGRRFIWQEVNSEFGADLANNLLGDGKLNLDYARPPQRDT